MHSEHDKLPLVQISAGDFTRSMKNANSVLPEEQNESLSMYNALRFN